MPNPSSSTQGPPDYATLQRLLGAFATQLSADPGNQQARSDFDVVHQALAAMRRQQGQADIEANKPGVPGSGLVALGHGLGLGLPGVETPGFTGASRGGGIARSVPPSSDAEYMAAAREANPWTTNVMDAVGTGITGTLATMAGVPAPLAYAGTGAARGAIDPSFTGSRVMDATIMGPGSVIAGAGAGKLLKPVFGKAVNRVVANVVKILERRGAGKIPGLQGISELIGRETVPVEAGAGKRTAAEITPNDLEELHHILNGEPTIAGYQTVARMIDRAPAGEVAGRAAQEATLSGADAAMIQEELRERVIRDLTERFANQKGLFGTKALTDQERMALARKLAEASVDQAGKQAAHVVKTPSVKPPTIKGVNPSAAAEAPQINPLVQAGNEAKVAAAAEAEAKRTADEVARAAYNLVFEVTKNKELAMAAAKRAAGFANRPATFGGGSSGL